MSSPSTHGMPSNVLSLFLLSVGLGTKVHLHTTLARLALIMLVCVLGLALTISRETSHSTTDSTSHTIADTLAEIVELTLCLLLLTCLVLVTSLLLEALAANQTAQCFLPAANCLVPGALSAVCIVFGGDTG
jgi:hypothetical protein